MMVVCVAVLMMIMLIMMMTTIMILMMQEYETEFGKKRLYTKHQEKETSGPEFRSDNQQDGCIPFQSNSSYNLTYRDC
jgi:hypothetical protein